jgi:S-DNA-T family DNA segregation ATPase FtsK/SpoIIIE
MADIYTGKEDEILIDLISNKGLNAKMPKWNILRICLSISLRIPAEPDEALDRPQGKGSEYHLEQITGEGKDKNEDFTDAFCALLSTYHNEDLFKDRKRFLQLLQRHIRRGLREIQLTWRESHDFHEYLFQELFSDSFNFKKTSPFLEDNLKTALTEIGVNADIQKYINGPRLTRFMLHLPDVNDLDRLRRGLEKLSFSLGLGQQGVFMESTEEPKVISLDVPRPGNVWQHVTGSRMRQWLKNPPSSMVLPVWPGVDVLGEPFVFDITQAPHLLVAGTTGSGKSVCLHSILISLILRNSPETLQVCLIDTKKVEFKAYNSLPHNFNKTVITDVNDAVSVLEKLVDEMEKRNDYLSKLQARDLIECHARGMKDIPYIVVFVEEMADLLMQSEQAEEYLVRLAQKARSVGIHLVLATQRPDAETFRGLLRSNIPTRIALTVQKASESKIILDEVGAEHLLGKGDMLIKLIGSKVKRIHGVNIRYDDIAAAVKYVQRT